MGTCVLLVQVQMRVDVGMLVMVGRHIQHLDTTHIFSSACSSSVCVASACPSSISSPFPLPFSFALPFRKGRQWCSVPFPFSLPLSAAVPLKGGR